MEETVWTCTAFEPQKWRKSKCKNCFQDKSRHLSGTKEDNGDNKNVDNEAVLVSYLKTPPAGLENEQQNDGGLCFQSQDDTLKSTENNEDLEINLEVQSHDIRNPDISRKLSYEATGVLSRFSTLEFSSTSSLASFDALEDATLSSYSYSGSRDNLDDSISADEPSFGEMTADKNITSESNEIILKLKDEIENIVENQKLMEHSKDLEIQVLAREIENLKLELTKYSARENITTVKSRLDLEGKNLRIEELENETKYLQSTIDFLKMNKYTDETEQDMLNEELKIKKKKVESLEEEARTLEERLKLAEDLQQNDKELLEVLRNQLMYLEKDLLSSEDRKKFLEENLKALQTVESELNDERYTVKKLNKEIDILNSKLALKEEHVRYLEDDNTKLQEKNSELKSKVKNDFIKIEKLNDYVKDLKDDIKECNAEIENLCTENCALENTHWQAVLDQAEASNEVQDYIKDLERRVSQSESRVRDLEFENEAILKESKELLDDLMTSKADSEELRKQLCLVTEKCGSIEQLKNDQDKRVITMQRKLKKFQKEKKRFHMEKTESEQKLFNMKNTNSKLLTRYNDIEKGYKMIQLKLQSTEAKLNMIEGNKSYLETKVNEFERKHITNMQKLVKLDDLVNQHLHGWQDEKSTKQTDFSFDSFEVKLVNVMNDNIKNKSEINALKEANSEQELLLKSHEMQMKESSKRDQLDARTECSEQLIPVKGMQQFEDICTCLTNSLQDLKKQNEVLENEMNTVADCKSSLDSIQECFIPGDPGICTTSPSEKGSFDTVKGNINNEKSIMCGLKVSKGTEKNATATDNALIKGQDNPFLFYEVHFKASSLDEFKVKPFCIKKKQQIENFYDDNRHIKLQSNRAALDFKKFNSEEESKEEVSSSNIDKSVRNENKGFLYNSKQCPVLLNQIPLMFGRSIDSNQKEGDESENNQTEKTNNMNCPGETESSTKDQPESTKSMRPSLRLVKPNSCHKDNGAIHKLAESIACNILEQATTDAALWQKKSILSSCLGLSKADEGMEKDRPFASVKCIFQAQSAEDTQVHSSSDPRKLENGAHTLQFPTCPPKKKRAEMIHESVEIAEPRLQQEEDTNRKKMITPHYTVAMSPVQKAFINEDDRVGDHCNDAVDESKQNGRDDVSLDNPVPVTINQEKWGSITLTIPASSLDNTDNHLEDDLEHTPRYQISQERTRSSTLPPLTVIFDKPRFEGRRLPTKEKLLSKTSFSDDDDF